MANYAKLKSDLDKVIKTNTQRSITGNVLNDQLDAMIDALGLGWQYMGEAMPGTNPGSPDARVAYLAFTPGTYTYFDNMELEDGRLAFIRWDGSWHKDEFQFYIAVDPVPTNGSTNPVRSGGVFTALDGKENSSNKVRSLSASSNDDQYPTAKCVWDIVSGLTSPLDGYEVVATLPEASASTMGALYVLTGEDTSTLYITAEDEGTYSWQPVGELATSITVITTGEIDALFN